MLFLQIPDPGMPKSGLHFSKGMLQLLRILMLHSLAFLSYDTSKPAGGILVIIY